MRSPNSNSRFEYPQINSSNSYRNHGRPNAFRNSFPHSEIAKMKFGCSIRQVGKNFCTSPTNANSAFQDATVTPNNSALESTNVLFFWK
jgi:hypothetical protein